MTEEKKEVFLEADKEIPGQHYVCLSFISPNEVLKNKDVHFFSEFMKDYEIQYRIKATESFVMAQVLKVQEAASQVQDVLENLKIRGKDITVEDLSGSLKIVTDMRASLTSNASSELETHVKQNMADFKENTIEEAYKTFLFKNRKKMEEDFFAKNSFRTTVQGLKVRGVYDTYNEAAARAKTIQKLDPSFNVYVGQVGFWLPWDPSPQEVADQEYADDQLNTLMKNYKSNEAQRDEFYASTKQSRLAGAKIKGESDAKPTDMFATEDLAIARKRENAENTVVHS